MIYSYFWEPNINAAPTETNANYGHSAFCLPPTYGHAKLADSIVPIFVQAAAFHPG